MYVTPSSERSSTGTHYTPTSLTEPIVQYTLEPLVYEGPKEGKPNEDWKLKSAEEILKLRICDPAMGSGAFLVQTCRYMAERLAEAWENAESDKTGKLLTTPSGHESEGFVSERLIPNEQLERISIARRLIADKCLYGVDINPMAVEMAKLSIWLITVDKKRPFTFLDHAFKCGNSLFGITTMEQLEYFDFHPDKVKQLTFGSYNLRQHFNEAREIHEELVEIPSESLQKINSKTELNSKIIQLNKNLKNIADILVSFENDNYKDQDIAAKRQVIADQINSYVEDDSNKLSDLAIELLDGRIPLHWNLTFPAVYGKGGFDAIVGNPPFLGGWRISSSLGQKFMTWITKILFSKIKRKCGFMRFFFCYELKIFLEKTVSQD